MVQCKDSWRRFCTLCLRYAKWYLLMCKLQSERELQFSRCSDIGQGFAPIGLHKTDAASDWLPLKQHYLGKKGLPGVSPAYCFAALALVKCSNEGGPGPRYNRKEDPGSSIFSMLKVHGCHLYLMPRFSEAGDNRTRGMGLPPIRATWAEPPPTPFKYILLPQPRCQ